MSPAYGAHLPWARIDQHLDALLDLGLAPELALKGPDLDEMDARLLGRVARRLADAGVRPTVHAPFFDLNPGALDPLVRQVTYRRLGGCMTVAGELNAHLMVVHPGFDRWRYPNLDRSWLTLAAEFFPPLLEQAQQHDCRLALENIYEETPDTLISLVDGLASPWLGHCFDAGHWHLFGKRPMANWLAALGDRLLHLHLHDNHGSADQHLPVGDGSIDFSPLKAFLATQATRPSMTLEAHTPEHLERSLARVGNLL